MNTRIDIARRILLLAVAAVPLTCMAGEPRSVAREVVIDCVDFTLPSQRAVGEMVGQHNFGQVYATRARLLVEARRACRRENAAQVRLVLAPPERVPIPANATAAR